MATTPLDPNDPDVAAALADLDQMRKPQGPAAAPAPAPTTSGWGRGVWSMPSGDPEMDAGRREIEQMRTPPPAPPPGPTVPMNPADPESSAAGGELLDWIKQQRALAEQQGEWDPNKGWFGEPTPKGARTAATATAMGILGGSGIMRDVPAPATNPLTGAGPSPRLPPGGPGAHGAPPPPPPAPGGGAPAPESAGAAATPAELAGISPKEVAVYRQTQEGSKLVENQPVGVRDDKAYIPREVVSIPEQLQTAEAARAYKALRQQNPDVEQQARLNADNNNTERTNYFDATAGSPADLFNAKNARDAQATKDLAAAFSNKQQANAQPVVDLGHSILTDPRDSVRPAITNPVNDVLGKLTKPDGTLVTDPETLYGVREHINDLLSDQTNARASSRLLQLKAALDQQIEAAAPGFRQYLTNYSNASRRIDEMTALQGVRSRLFDTKGYIQLGNVQRVMKGLVDARGPTGSPTDPARSISDENMDRLWNLRDTLRRADAADQLARARGSDTVQNAWDTLRQAATSTAGEAALHLGVGHILPGVGNALLGFGRQAWEAARAGQIARQNVARGIEMASPSTPLTHPETGEQLNPFTGAPINPPPSPFTPTTAPRWGTIAPGSPPPQGGPQP